ncbi:tyrosine-type recombinase/integrase [Bacillus mycoides]|uniref:tyrosine-type recombinase/integrase n=1 Tax=Bacillus mycoides TaxID=1405 RepID=UPI0009CA7FB8|nr:tyrosine-type recombinase/integrase [Bacillus mycoides]OOR15771.1 hypothetical protein BW891_24535 [Bacillus mycoides]
MTEKYLDAQLKKLNKILTRAQQENSEEKKQLLKKLDGLEKGSSQWDKLSREINGIQTISDGTKENYYNYTAAVLRDAYEKFGVAHFKNLTPEKTEELLRDRIQNGQSANTIRNVAHALDFVNKHAVKTRVFKEKDNFQITNHSKMLETIKEKNVKRSYKDSHRYKATGTECMEVIEEMKKYDPHLASIAQYQYLTGFRVSEAISQKANLMDLENHKHHAVKAKGGLDNVVHTNHHNSEEKAFLAELKASHDKETGRVFARQKDADGNYKSDKQTRLALTRLARRCADRLGICGPGGETFSSHSFRGGFAHNRMVHYCQNHDRIDQIIAEKIGEQPRLQEKHAEFEKKIRDKIKEENREDREIQVYEKIQWVISTDLNHSRQDITRFYTSGDAIKAELSKYK